MTPIDRKYRKSHEWVKIEDGIATIGITDHAQEALGDITFIELPEDDAELAAGDDAAVVESVKAASDIYAPIGGTVSAVNESLEDEPELVNNSPFEDGWIFKLTDINEGDLADLLTAEEYNSFLESEA